MKKEDKKTEKDVNGAPAKIPKKQGWKLVWWALLLLCWCFIAVLGTNLLVGVIFAFILPADVAEKPMVTGILSALSYTLALIVTIWLPPKMYKKMAPSTREKLGLSGLPTWTDLGLGAVGYGVTLLLEAGVTALFELLPWFDSEQAQELRYSFYMEGWEKAIAFVAVAVIAPIVEEIIFRGWLYGKLRVRIPKVVAILLTSLLFGLVHLQWNIGVAVFAMSIVMCTLREVTGTIYAGILVHMINNSVAFILLYVVGSV